jgi:hypothetical protein
MTAAAAANGHVPRGQLDLVAFLGPDHAVAKFNLKTAVDRLQVTKLVQ